MTNTEILTKTILTYIANAKAQGIDQATIERTIGQIIAAFNI